MRPDQTVSTLWTINSSCTTRQIMPTTVVCNTRREKMYAIPPRRLSSWITTIQKLLFGGQKYSLLYLHSYTRDDNFKFNRPHLPCYEIMDPFICTSQSSVSWTLRNVLLNISLLNLTEVFLFCLWVSHTSFMLLLEHFCLKFLAVSSGKGHI